MQSDQASLDLTVVPNASLLGCISGRLRQVDVLIDARVAEDVSRRTIVDAKLRRRRIDVKDIESFEGMMKDCRAQRGVLVCSNGYTKAAKRRAQKSISITLLPEDEIEDANLSQWERCLGQCVSAGKTDRTHGWVLYDQVFSAESGNRPASLISVGKCDGCRDFHVWCWDCGQMLALEGNEAEAKCACDRFWLTAVEDEGEDEYGNQLTSVLLLKIAIPSGQWKVFDRRPLN